jgi:predicted aspartyl protease
MNQQGNGAMGRFAVDVELASNADLILAQLGMLPPEKVRRITARGIVDSGATLLVLPESIVKQLGLSPAGTVTVQYADDRQATRPRVGNVAVRLLGRESVFDGWVEPNRKDVLIGAVVLEVLDLLIDCKNQRLVPRDPTTITGAAGSSMGDAGSGNV